MKIIELEKEIKANGIFPIENGWIIKCWASDFCHFIITPDGNYKKQEGYIYQDHLSKSLRLQNDKIFYSVYFGVDKNGKITDLENSYVPKINQKYGHYVFDHDAILSLWLNIDYEKETGILFLNKETKQSSILGIPLVFQYDPDEDYRQENYILGSFSEDGLTFLILKKDSNKLIILDNPVV